MAAKGIYIKEVAQILAVSTNKANQLANEGKIPYHQAGNSRRIFDRETVLELAKSLEFKALRRSKKVLVYARCRTKKEERSALQKIKLHCQQNNWKPTIISQLDRGESSTQAYNRAVKYFRTGSQALIVAGTTRDLEELTKMFSAVGLDTLSFERDIKDQKVVAIETVMDSGITRTKSAFVYC